MSSLQALVGSSADCSGGNSMSQFVKQLERTGAVEQDLFRQGGPSEEHFGPLMRERPGRQAEFDERQFVDEFLNGAQMEPRFANGFGKFNGPSFDFALEAELAKDVPGGGLIKKNEWAADFETFHHAEPPHDDLGFDAAFNRALQQVPEAWRDEFVQSVPVLERHEFERAFAEHHNADLETAFSREFAAVQDTLTQAKGKGPMTLGANGKEEISWEDEFAREFNGEDMDLNKLGEMFKQFDMGSDAVRDWEKDYENFDFGGNDADEILDPDPVTAACAPYVFESNNPYISHPDPMAEGQRLLETGGSLSEAALAFEAAAQRDPENSEAWASLGTTQAENEKEGPAIAALQRSVQINPENQRALMALAVSYTNEGQELQAYATLERWLATQYPSIASVHAPSGIVNRSDIHARVTDFFLEAARQGPAASIASLSQAIDPDVQIGLGVLFYNSSDYSKAIDCFTSALSSRPNDYLLWNRLGATLANSGRSEEAIDAYYKALELKPSFVRGRYNLGVSCINVGCYKEAAEHLLGALAMHVRGEENVSGNLWETLRRAFILMERRDLAEKAGKETDVEEFREEFEF